MMPRTDADGSPAACHPDTRLVHAGRSPATRWGGMVNPPVYRGSTVLYDSVAHYEARDPTDFKTLRYGVHGTPTAFAFEEAVAQLEGAHAAVALPSGMAAVAVALSALAQPGGHVLIADTVYGPARSFCERRLRPFGIQVQYYDPGIGAGIAALLRDDTQLVYCESPGSFTFQMQDIPAIACAAHARGIPVIADNTWATPYGFAPFAHGVDISIHAGTKYLSGHSDVMIGTLSTTQQYWGNLRRTVADFGYCVSPDDCYLALRGLRTLGVRLSHQMRGALAVASWLQQQPQVRRVLYPALPGDAGHALWQRDCTAAASVFGVVLAPASDASVQRMLDALSLFGMGSSWGGYESLAIRCPREPQLRTATQWPDDGPLLRLHIGLEHADDLIEDLAQGLALLRPGV